VSRRTTTFFVALYAAMLLGFAVVPSAAGRDVVQTVVTSTALLAGGWHLRRRREVWAKGPGLLFLAVSVLGLSDALGAFELHVEKVDLYPRPSNVLALAGYALLGAGGVQFARHLGRGRPLPGRIEAAIFAFGAMVPLLVFLILPVVSSDRFSVAAKTTVIAYAVGDLVVGTVIARLMLVTRRQSAAFVLLAGAVFSALLGDFWSGLTTEQGPASAAAPIKVLWLTAFILFSAGIAHSSLPALIEGKAWQDDPSSKRRVWLMGVGQALPALTLAIAWVIGLDHSHLVIALGGLVVSLLVSARMVGLLDRISEQSVQLAALARSDDLTGLHNRRSWNHELSRACAAARDSGEPLCIALLDLDHFKVFNDTHGHPAGDALLKEAAAVWRGLLQPGQVLARYGGEEFSMLMPGTPLPDAVRVLDVLRQATPRGQRFSAGVALWQPGTDPAEAVAEADAALYRAKRSGRDRVVGAEIHGERDLPASLEALRVVVQPIVRADGLDVVGHEALSRFPHETDVPGVFSRAHERGYGDLLELLAIHRAVEVAHRPAGTELYVNVSERAMRSARFWDRLPDDLSGVVVELHEDRDGLDDDTVAEYLQRFRDRNARIGMDDLGVRATDLARIVTLRPDIVKIDRSLVAGCDVNGGQADVVRMLVDFGRSRGVEVCVEGVETPGELAVVRDAGATLVQGYLVGRPQPDWVTDVDPAVRARLADEVEMVTSDD
jgi:diguanylate cyclase (GGDEF)-like protein